MQPGYLLLEQPDAGRNLVRLSSAAVLPPAPGAALRFAAHFQDLEAALMHFHEGVRRHIVDVDERLYRTDIINAVAVADAIELPHRRAYIDPTLAAEPALESTIASLHARHRRWARVFNGVGIAALILLVLTAVLGV